MNRFICLMIVHTESLTLYTIILIISQISK